MDRASNWRDMTMNGKLVAVETTVVADTEAEQAKKSLQSCKDKLFR